VKISGNFPSLIRGTAADAASSRYIMMLDDCNVYEETQAGHAHNKAKPVEKKQEFQIKHIKIA
jgi:hypothetical protein